MVKIVEKDGKKTQVFDLTDPKDMELANKIAKDELAKMKGQTDADKEVEKFKTEAELEEENQQLKEKIQLVAEQAFEAKKQKIGCSDPEIDTFDKLEAWQSGRDTHGTPVKEGASGSLPLNDAQIYGGARPEGFESQEALIDDLRRRSHLGDKIAEKQLGQLLVKSLKGIKEQRQGVKEFIPEENDSEIQRLNKQWREKHILRKREKGDD